MMWAEKYRPSNPSRIIGNEDERTKFITWIKTWDQKKKPILLIGPSGVGKTTLVHSAASFYGFKVIEINASDIRTYEKLNRILSPLIYTKTLVPEKILVFLDEVDGLHGRANYKGQDAIIEFIKANPTPIVMSANIEDDKKLKKIMTQSTKIRFKRIPFRLAKLYLMQILEKEETKIEPKVIDKIIKTTKGDIRSMLNSAQSMINAKEEDELPIRDYNIALNECVNSLFTLEDKNECYKELTRSKEPARDFINAIYRSIMANKLKPEDTLKMLQALTNSELILSRIFKTQKWHLLRYFNRSLVNNMNQTISTPIIYSETDIPWPIQIRIWNESRILTQIGKRIGRITHSSSKEVVGKELHYFLAIIGEENIEKVSKQLGLDETEQKVIIKETNRVLKELK